MSFLNRLFSRKAKSAQSAYAVTSLRRSLTDPVAASSGAALRGEKTSSSEGETDTFSLSNPLPRARGTNGRRGGCELMRSKTSIEATTSIRSSTSSSGEGTPEDPVRSLYRSVMPIHRSRCHTILSAQDRQTKQSVVLKAYPKAKLSSTSKMKLDAEVEHLKALSGTPGVAKFVNYVEDTDACYVVMERCQGHTLIELMANSGGRMHERTLVLEVLIPLLQCLAALHAAGVVHRQLKPEHVIVGYASMHLVDFSEAAQKSVCCLNNRAGAIEYMAPEVLNKPTAEEVFHQVLYSGMSEEELPQYDEKSDLWSLGAIVYEALTGCQPFMADGVDDMTAAHHAMLSDCGQDGVPRALHGRGLSADAMDFLCQAMRMDPAARPSAEQLLAHPLVVRYLPLYHVKQQHPNGHEEPKGLRKMAAATACAANIASAPSPAGLVGMASVKSLLGGPAVPAAALQGVVQ